MNIRAEANIYSDREEINYALGTDRPLELFLSSLSGCVGVYAKKYLSRHQIEFRKLIVKASADFTIESPARLVNLKLKVITDAELGDKKEVFLRFIENCPVHNTLLHTKEVEIALED